MTNYIIINKTFFTADYLEAISIILTNAGYVIKEDEEDKDILKIYYPLDNYMSAWALKVFHECNLQ